MPTWAWVGGGVVLAAGGYYWHHSRKVAVAVDDGVTIGTRPRLLDLFLTPAIDGVSRGTGDLVEGALRDVLRGS